MSKAGSNLSNAMKKHPKVFNELYTSMIQAGEASGNLDTILLRLSQYIENMNKLIGKVKSAMAYPIAVLMIAFVLTGVILWKVVPVFTDMFSAVGRRTSPAHADRGRRLQFPGRQFLLCHHRHRRR